MQIAERVTVRLRRPQRLVDGLVNAGECVGLLRRDAEALIASGEAEALTAAPSAPPVDKMARTASRKARDQ